MRIVDYISIGNSAKKGRERLQESDQLNTSTSMMLKMLLNLENMEK